MMKTIGLIGGLSWYSTAVYYKLINENLNRRLGGSSSAKILLYSVDFSEFDTLQKAGNWKEIT
jgi:aspartate racemase